METIALPSDGRDDSSRQRDKDNKISGWEYCSKCGTLAVDKLELKDAPENFEYYCECGHAWWGMG